MPSLTLHLVFADRALAAIEDALDPSLHGVARDPVQRDAFRQGAFGPDLGYFPGGDRYLSDLAHCVRTGALNRAVFHQARSATERAFALGWLTHVLADRLVHPAVGLASGEFTYGTRELFVDAGTDPVTHVQIETGLDAFYAARLQGPVVPPRVDFRLPTLRFLVQAYTGTYGVRFRLRDLAYSYWALRRSARAGLRIIRAFAGRCAGGRATEADSLATAATRGRWRKIFPMSVAFLTPIAPAAWLVDHVEAALRDFPALFLHHAAHELAELDDANLETGEPESDVRHHPTTAVTLARLRSERVALAGRRLDVAAAIAAPVSVGP